MMKAKIPPKALSRLTPSEKKKIRESTIPEISYSIDFEYFKTIESALGRELSGEQRVEIDKAIRIWTATIKCLPPRNPPIGLMAESQRKIIERTLKNTKELIYALENFGHLFEYPPIEKTVDSLNLLLVYVERTQKKEGKPTGKVFSNPVGFPLEIDRHVFIRRLADIYKGVTGQDKKQVNKNHDGVYAGPFFRFIEACINPFEPQLSNKALGRAINTALKNPE